MTDYATLLRAALDRGFPLEPALAALRERGATNIDAVKALREIQNLSLAETKQVVDDSEVWSNPRK